MEQSRTRPSWVCDTASCILRLACPCVCTGAAAWNSAVRPCHATQHKVQRLARPRACRGRVAGHPSVNADCAHHMRAVHATDEGSGRLPTLCLVARRRGRARDAHRASLHPHHPRDELRCAPVRRGPGTPRPLRFDVRAHRPRQSGADGVRVRADRVFGRADRWVLRPGGPRDPPRAIDALVLVAPVPVHAGTARPEARVPGARIQGPHARARQGERAHARAHTRARAKGNTYTHKCTLACVRARAYTHTLTHARTQACSHTHTHARARAQTH